MPMTHPGKPVPVKQRATEDEDMAEPNELALLGRIIRDVRITPHFQPIVDLFSQSVLGYEVLSRGEGALRSPVRLFGAARKNGLLWELERACRIAALGRISRLPSALRRHRFFINISPDILTDDRFLQGFTHGNLSAFGIDQDRLVIEMTEEATSLDHGHLEALVRRFTSQGFHLALDDFGRGHSSLLTLVAVSPHYLKLDRMMIRDIHQHAHKQHLVKAVAGFASSVDTIPIAEGVETWEELEVLLRLGIRYVQGYLVARPAAEPPEVPAEFRRRASAMCAQLNYPRVATEETISTLVIRPRTLEHGTHTCEEVTAIFQHEKHVDHIVLVTGDKPKGLVTRRRFYLETGGAFGYQLFQKKAVESVAKADPLIVQDRMRVTALARLAMARLPEDVYDPVLVVDDNGNLLGSLTVKQLLTRSVELEIKTAMGANPLTNLPGNRAIQDWLESAIDSEEFTVVYADLDQFKAYNDAYGFLMGDEMIRLTAQLLREHREQISPDAMLGHVGGDDFVIVAPGEIDEGGLQSLCRAFDERKIELFRPDDALRGSYFGVDRKGQRVEVPIVTLSLAVIRARNIPGEAHPAVLSQVAASLKKRAKQIAAVKGRSTYLSERRTRQTVPYEGPNTAE